MLAADYVILKKHESMWFCDRSITRLKNKSEDELSMIITIKELGQNITVITNKLERAQIGQLS